MGCTHQEAIQEEHTSQIVMTIMQADLNLKEFRFLCVDEETVHKGKDPMAGV